MSNPYYDLILGYWSLWVLYLFIPWRLLARWVDEQLHGTLLGSIFWQQLSSGLPSVENSPVLFEYMFWDRTKKIWRTPDTPTANELLQVELELTLNRTIQTPEAIAQKLQSKH